MQQSGFIDAIGREWLLSRGHVLLYISKPRHAPPERGVMMPREIRATEKLLSRTEVRIGSSFGLGGPSHHTLPNDFGRSDSRRRRGGRGGRPSFGPSQA